MGHTFTSHPSLLSSARLDFFRTQLTSKHEAAFLAPQLLEQVTILTKELGEALRELTALRNAVAELATVYEQSQVAANEPPPDLMSAVRAAVAHVTRDSSGT